ncbi:MAG: dTDP-4-dehydrorhamnose reductase, partial [Candidatus Methylomirabilales bacterium]
MRILVTGAKGQLGVELLRSLAPLGEVVGRDLPELDIVRPAAAGAVAALAPDCVVHAAAATDVDGCERDPALAMAVNGDGTRHVAEGCRRAGARLVYLSTDFVFDGAKRTPYLEDDPPAPLSAYGRSKLEGERAAQRVPDWCIVRTAWLYGPHGRNFVKAILRKAAAGERLRVVHDQVGSPTYAPDLAAAIARLVAGKLAGTYHVTNAGACSWYEFAREILRQAGLAVPVQPIDTRTLDRPAPRPAYSVLAHAALERAGLPPMRPWREALADMLAALRGGAA